MSSKFSGLVSKVLWSFCLIYLSCHKKFLVFCSVSCQLSMWNLTVWSCSSDELCLAAVFGRPVGGGNLRDSDAEQRQQRSQTDHRPTDGPLRLPERPDRRHHQGPAGLRGRWVQWPADVWHFPIWHMKLTPLSVLKHTGRMRGKQMSF